MFDDMFFPIQFEAENAESSLMSLLGKGTPLPAKHALRSTASRPAEPCNIRVTVH